MIKEQERADILKQVQAQMTQKRFEHVLRVEEEAIQLARQYGVDIAECQYAALLHDYAKEWTTEQYQSVVRAHHLDENLLGFGSEILHGPVASAVAKQQFGVSEDVANAIYVHTIGAPVLSDVAKVLFIADYIEKGRTFTGVQTARTLAYDNLDKAVLYKLQHTIQFLAEKGVSIYPDTVIAYNEWIKHK